MDIGHHFGGTFCSGMVRSQDIDVPEGPSVREAQSAEEKLFRNREALITALMEQMEDVERSLSLPEKEGTGSLEKKGGEKVE